MIYFTIYSDVDNVNVSFCDLTWCAPEDDGGSDITGYQILMREVGRKKWSKISASIGSEDTSYRVDNLAEGSSYEFGVSSHIVSLFIMKIWQHSVFSLV